MKRIFACFIVLISILSSCQKEDEAPNVDFKTFSIKELDGFAFTFDKSSEPFLISNEIMLPIGTDISSLTPVFELTNEGGLFSQSIELESGVSTVDFSESSFLKTIDENGEIDHYYQVKLDVESPAGPVINKLDFTLNPYGNTPLAGLLEIDIDKACTLELQIKGQDNNDLTKKFETPATSFSVPVLGLYSSSTNHVIVTLTDQEGNINQEGIYITTQDLPELYPGAQIITSEPSQMEPGMIHVYLKRYNDGLNNGTRPLACIIDAYGKVRWNYTGDFNAPMKRLKNGNWLITVPDGAFEMDMLGHRTGNEWNIPHVHHDIVELPNGNFLALSEHSNSVEDIIIEVGRESGFVEKEWDLKDILDPERPKIPFHPNKNDWLHLNGLDYDENDDAIILSGRNQSVVCKIAKETGAIIWILGMHDKWPEEFQKYLLTPVGENFEWSFGQHAPMLHPDDPSRLILFDNGNERRYENPVPALENYSRGVEYQIDEDKMEIRQLWQYGKERGRELFCPYICDADYLLKTDNRLICFGGVTRNLNGEPTEIFNFETGLLLPVKNYTHLVEVSNSGQVVFEVVFADNSPGYAGYRSYRAEKLSLYPN